MRHTTPRASTNMTTKDLQSYFGGECRQKLEDDNLITHPPYTHLINLIIFTVLCEK